MEELKKLSHQQSESISSLRAEIQRLTQLAESAVGMLGDEPGKAQIRDREWRDRLDEMEARWREQIHISNLAKELLKFVQMPDAIKEIIAGHLEGVESHLAANAVYLASGQSGVAGDGISSPNALRENKRRVDATQCRCLLDVVDCRVCDGGGFRRGKG